MLFLPLLCSGVYQGKPLGVVAQGGPGHEDGNIVYVTAAWGVFAGIGASVHEVGIVEQVECRGER